MIPYYILLILVVTLSNLSEFYKRNSSLNNFFIYSYSFIMIIFAGIRHYSVGTDTGSYTRSFIKKRIELSTTINEFYKNEKAYDIVVWISQIFYDNYISLLLLSSLIIVAFQIKSINKISISPVISVYALITFGFYTFFFNGLRQGFALAIYVYSIQFIINKNFIKYLIFVFFGYFFHNTIVLMIPMYFVFRLSFSFKLLFIFFISTILIILFFDNLLDLSHFISDKYLIYQEIKASGGELLTISYLLLSLFFISIRKAIHPQLIQYYDIFLNMFLIGTIIFIVVQITGAYIEITRLAIYFLISIIFLWALILKGVKKKLKVLCYIVFTVSSLAFFYLHLIKIGHLIPYKINEIFIY